MQPKVRRYVETRTVEHVDRVDKCMAKLNMLFQKPKYFQSTRLYRLARVEGSLALHEACCTTQPDYECVVHGVLEHGATLPTCPAEAAEVVYNRWDRTRTRTLSVQLSSSCESGVAPSQSLLTA